MSCNEDNQTLPLIVVEKAGASLFSLAFQVDANALLYHNTPTTLPSTIDCNVIEKYDRDLQRVLEQYPAVFEPGLGLIVVVQKPNGKVSVCGDCKMTVNPQLL